MKLCRLQNSMIFKPNKLDTLEVLSKPVKNKVSLMLSWTAKTQQPVLKVHVKTWHSLVFNTDVKTPEQFPKVKDLQKPPSPLLKPASVQWNC